MAFEFKNQWFDHLTDPLYLRALNRDQLRRVAPEEPNLAAYEYLEYWLDRPVPPSPFYDLVQGNRVRNVNRVEQVDTWSEWTPERKREALQIDIDSQVPVHSATDTLRNQLLEEDVKRYSSAATEKAKELQETEDADLDTFDTSLGVAQPQDTGIIYSRMTSSIVYLDPWAGAPDDDIGLYVLLEVNGNDPSQGSEARVLIKNGPDWGAILPFTQDASEPQKWECTSRDGHKWSDPATHISFEILWGAGSLPVTPIILLTELHDRRADFLRYGTVATRSVRPIRTRLTR